MKYFTIYFLLKKLQITLKNEHKPWQKLSCFSPMTVNSPNIDKSVKHKIITLLIIQQAKDLEVWSEQEGLKDDAISVRGMLNNFQFNSVDLRMII